MVKTVALFITNILLAVQQNNAFCPSEIFGRSPANLIQPPHQYNTFLLRQSFVPFADTTEPKNPEPIEQKDINGKIFKPDTVVAIAPNTEVKAHHVPKSMFGSFDPKTREFIPVDELNIARTTSCLLLSEGLRGKVTKVYNVNEWDRTHPILVEFKKGLDREESEEGFVLPKSFAMYFSADEIIVVE